MCDNRYLIKGYVHPKRRQVSIPFGWRNLMGAILSYGVDELFLYSWFFEYNYKVPNEEGENSKG